MISREPQQFAVTTDSPAGITGYEPRPEPPRARPSWLRLSEEKLLHVRLCDLDLRIEGTRLEDRIARVHAELSQRGLKFRPHYWLSSEWFTPDGVPGVAFPFYLAHPRLQRLEEKLMLEAEGGTANGCMRILRHEIGHAIDNAYLLHNREKWCKLFGRYTRQYPRYYQPKPYSRRYVLHLDNWYAQSHPAEDFAETFAVWLTPMSKWQKRYAGWPALKKLEYVDELMTEISAAKPVVRSRARVEPLHKLRITLAEYYEQKRAVYGEAYPDFYDRDLRRLFSDAPELSDNEPAAKFLRRIRPELRRLVARWTGEHQYTIDQVLKEMTARCDELKLRVNRPEDQAKLEATILLSVQTMNYLHAGYHRLVL